MTNQASHSSHPGRVARDHAASGRRSSRRNVGAVLGLAVSLVVIAGCGDEETERTPESQRGGLSPAGGSSSATSPGQGGASTSEPGAGGSSAPSASGGSESSLPTDIPLGVGGASAGSSAFDGGVAVDGGAGPSPVTGPADPTVFAPCPADGTPCRVMPLGDSITDGIDSTMGYASNGGYRLELFRQAVLGGHDITFVGTRPPNGPSGNVEGVPFPRDHEGISGNTIQQVADRVGAALAANPPHVVLLQIGTNNLYQGMAPDVPGQLASLIDRITEGAPDALVAVAQITPLGGQFPNGGVEEYNAAIPGIVQERVAAGKHLIVVDQFTRIASTPSFVAQLLPDDIHPNGSGYAILGETWYGAIEPYLP